MPHKKGTSVADRHGFYYGASQKRGLCWATESRLYAVGARVRRHTHKSLSLSPGPQKEKFLFRAMHYGSRYAHIEDFFVWGGSGQKAINCLEFIAFFSFFTMIFNRCLETGNFPDYWNVSDIVPIPKSRYSTPKISITNTCYFMIANDQAL